MQAGLRACEHPTLSNIRSHQYYYLLTHLTLSSASLSSILRLLLILTLLSSMSLHQSAISGRSVAAAASEPAALWIRRLLVQPSTSSTLILVASVSIRTLDL